MPATVDPEKVLEDGASILHEKHGTNLAFKCANSGGDAARAFAEAEKVVEVRIANQRLIPSAMEPRAVAALYDADNDHYTIWSSTQIPHSIKEEVSAVFGIKEEQMRATAPEVGGGFGTKSNVFSEEILAPFLYFSIFRGQRSKESGSSLLWNKLSQARQSISV